MTTTAEVFSDYLGLTPENAPWAWTQKDWCKTCDQFLARGFVCKSCNSAIFVFKKHKFTATSPLAPEPTPGWLEALVMDRRFKKILRIRTGYVGYATTGSPCAVSGRYRERTYPNPTHAVARALIAADHTLREACERASDYEKETSNG